MALATYSDLKQAVANYLARTDLTDLIPTFIALGEVRFNRELKLRANLKRAVTTTVDATNTPSAFVLFPTDYNQIKSVTITGTPNRLLDFIPASQFPGLSGSSEVGKPSFFTVLGNQIRLGPSPDAAYTMELVYYSNFSALSDSSTSNWLMANGPDIYLYATLIEAEPYLMNDARVQLWKSLYDEAIAKISNNDDAGEFGAGALGMRSTYLVTR
jgi:hypothetical protein